MSMEAAGEIPSTTKKERREARKLVERLRQVWTSPRYHRNETAHSYRLENEMLPI